MALSAVGRVVELAAEERPSRLQLFLKKLPYLREFVQSPSCALMRLQVQSYNLVSRFQKVMVPASVMNYLLRLSDIKPADRARVGGKGYALAHLAEQGLRVPETVCLTNLAYNDYLDETGLRERILMELNRKDFQEMRWEEIWDASLRIRNFFLTTPMPGPMADAMEDYCRHWGNRPVVVRSSAPDEDAAGSSFAGLHESFVNVMGAGAILHHIKLVWASLWSDAALLYRQELGLNIRTSSMAVVIQELITGEVSGVAFSRNPMNETQTAIEAVYRLKSGAGGRSHRTGQMDD